MTKSKVFFVIFLVVMVSTVSFVRSTNASTMSMTVSGGEKVSQNIGLEVDDQLVIQFKVIGQKNSVISFSITYPNSTQISYGEISEYSQTLLCDATGEYTLNFINNDVSESKLVSLNYNVEHYVFGIPKLFFFAIIIAVICLAMIAAIAYMGKII